MLDDLATKELEGKRSARRRENANFAHNPHVAPPSSADLALPLQRPPPIFPHPLLPRTLVLPPARPPPTLPSTSGLFSLSLRGVRRTLRARPSSAPLVTAVESHLSTWLHGGTYLNPDQAKGTLRFPGDPVGGRHDIREVGREPGRLVWAVKPASPLGHADGGFERYVVHCVARWYGVVSFSKDTDGHRLTHLLRPRPASRTLDTPPATDASDVHVSDAGLSDTDTSEVDSPAGDTRSLSDIQESRPASPASWSAIGADSDADDRGFAASVESLALPAHIGRDDGVASRAHAGRDRLHALYPRATSSPSPARRSPRRFTVRKLGARRRKAKKAPAGGVGTDQGSFYDYLFA